MCLFISAREEIDFPWLSEVLSVLPEGPESKLLEVELVLNGLVRSKQEKSKIVFVHRGEIYALRDRSNEVLSTNQGLHDWITHKVLNYKYEKIKSAAHGKCEVCSRPSALAIPAIIASVKLGNIKVYCKDRTYEHKQANMPQEPKFKSKNPIFSSFSVTFPRREMNFFRISFRTGFGLRNHHSQVAFDVQGPDLAMRNIIEDITSKVTDVSRKQKLWQEVGVLYNSAKEPQYEVAIVGHPLISLATERMRNTEKLDDFSMDTKDTDIKSAASPTRVICFGINQKDVLVQAVAGITRGPGYYSYSQEFLEDMKKLNRSDSHNKAKA
jgi:hypothetical protein